MASPNAVTVTRTPAYSARIAKTFQQLRLDDEITDFTIHSGKQSFNCHRVILAGSSPVLQAMVRSGMTEASENKANIDTIPPSVMQLVMDYVYTGEVVVPHEHLQETIKAADYLQLMELKEICLSDADTALKPSNIVSWYKLADRLEIEKLRSKCAEVMSSSLAEISRFTEFQELEFAEVSSFMSSAQETDADPDDLLEASMEWINYKPSQRVDCMEEVLQKIQLLECSVECLENEMEIHEALLVSCPLAYRVISKALLQIAKKGVVRKKRGAKRKAQVMFVVLGGQHGWRAGDLNKVCWELNASLQLEELCSIPEHPFRFGVCKIPDGFVLTGGQEGCTLCSMFVLSTHSWKQLQALKVKRHAHGSIFMTGKIFVFGGYTSNECSVHSLALDGNKWTEEAELPNAVAHPEVVSVENSIFLLDVYSNKLLHMDTETKTWYFRKRAPGSVSAGARMVVVQGQILVAGGNKTTAQYDPKTDTWCTLNSPTLKHEFGALVGLDKKLYLIGGLNEDRIEEYNLVTGTWSVCDMRFPKELYHLHALALDI